MLVSLANSVCIVMYTWSLCSWQNSKPDCEPWFSHFIFNSLQLTMRLSQIVLSSGTLLKTRKVLFYYYYLVSEHRN